MLSPQTECRQNDEFQLRIMLPVNRVTELNNEDILGFLSSTHLGWTKWPTGFAEEIFKCNFLTENYNNFIQISRMLGSNNMLKFVKLMAWHRNRLQAITGTNQQATVS